MPYKPHITAWSYSRYSVYKKCPFKAKCQYVDKLPVPSSPQMNRGSEVHSFFENNLKNKRNKIPEEFAFMRPVVEGFRKSRAVAEEEIAFDRLWQPTGWFDKNTWLRVKTDVGFWKESNWRITVDYKTGKEWDDHRDQSDLYALSELERFHVTGVEKVDVQFIYVDIPKLVTYEYGEAEHSLLKEIWNERGEVMTKDKIFKPIPGRHCRYCPFSKMQDGPCKY